MASTDRALYDMAEAILTQGIDRLRKGVDKRNLSALARMGYLVDFRDGSYSLTPKAMAYAVAFWKSVARDAEQYNPSKVPELQARIEKGERWLRRRHEDPSPDEAPFGDLDFKTYWALWNAVTTGTGRGIVGGSKIEDGWIPLPYARKLLKLGLIKWDGKAESFADPTPEAKALVAQHGDPFHPRTASTAYNYDRRGR